jgi:dTDP-4-dehydrorhamnose reductase
MKVLLTGAAGQLGQALIASRPEGVELVALGRSDLDLADAEACRLAVRQHQPDWLLNAGAYTAVDRAEAEAELALAVNAGAPQAFAEALAEGGGRLLQVSTDFVFNGQQGSPYRPDQSPQPLGVYGATKAAGERAVLAVLGAGRARILRTSWVYGPVGANFCLTMLRLHALKAAAGEALGVVADQVGCPSASSGLAAACWRAIGIGAPGLSEGSARAPLAPGAQAEPPDRAPGAATSAGVAQSARPGAVPLEPQLEPPHDPSTVLHWSDAGAASWYDFAVAIGELGVAAGLLEQAAQVRPIPTSAYPTPAARPPYSLLDCIASRAALGLEPTHWRAALQEVLAQVAALQRRRDARA